MPNGFLVCKNVPIARTGIQEYQGSELGITEHPEDLFHVYRDESEVFHPAALASFEGVPLVDEHPSNDVTVENACNLMRGFVKDVRRGDGEDSDKVIADIIVTDPIIIAEIENGKREISCGYKCDFDPDESGRIFQRNIRGNHVALVDKGRAGQDVAIKDAEPEAPAPTVERRPMFMKKPNKVKDGKSKGLLSKLLGIVTADADPEVVAEIAEQLVEAVEESAPVDEEPTAPEKTEPAPAPAAEKPKDEDPAPPWAAQILERMAKLEAAIATKTPDADPLNELEKEVAGAEETVTKPVEQMDEDEPASDKAALDADEPAKDEEPAAKDEEPEAKDEEPEKDKPTGDARDAIAKAKKQVAKIKDAATRRVVSDAMASLIRQTYGIKPSTPKDSYSKILASKRDSAKKAADAYPAFDSMESRQAAYDSRNPHMKKEVK
jgi:hypothetical protein